MYSSELLDKKENLAKPEHGLQLGKLALGGAGLNRETLGINDPLAHVDLYLRKGEVSAEYILAEFETDVAERLRKPRFINEVYFYKLGNDFVSTEGGFSMRKITTEAASKMAETSAPQEELERTKAEALEAESLLRWFDSAKPGEIFVVESMPLTQDESYAMARVYQKTSLSELKQSSITLHSPSLDTFNELRESLGASSQAQANNKQELLSKTYQPTLSLDGEFVENYVNAYDSILESKTPGKQFVFGLEAGQTEQFIDSLEQVRQNRKVSSIYLEAVREIAVSSWTKTPTLSELAQKLNLKLGSAHQTEISTDQAKQFLEDIRQYITATIDENGATGQLSETDVYATVSHYGGEARSAGVRYESDACPSYGSLSKSAQTELSALRRGYGLEADPTKCVTCPNCKNTVDLPEDLYRQNVLHCTACKKTVTRNGLPMNRQAKKILTKMYNADEPNKQQETFSQWIRRISQKHQTRQS